MFGGTTAKLSKALLSPAEKRVPLTVALELELGVALEREPRRKLVDLDRMVDHELDGHERVDLRGVSRHVGHRVAHGGEVHDGGYAREVLHQDACGSERDLVARLVGRDPASDVLDVLGGDGDAVLGAEKVLEQDLQRVGQPGDVVLGLEGVEAKDLVGLIADAGGSRGNRTSCSSIAYLYLPSTLAEGPKPSKPPAGAADQWSMVVLYICLGVLTVAILWLILTYNGLVKSRNKVDESWSGIDVQLKRRHDLVPNLVETVRGYAAHERETLAQLAQARSAAMAATTPFQIEPAEARLGSALGQVWALAEAYPELEAAESFRRLQAELAATEDEIQAARRIYNSNVQDFNTRIQVFPNNLIAGRLSFSAREFLEIEVVADRAVPQVAV